MNMMRMVTYTETDTSFDIEDKTEYTYKTVNDQLIPIHYVRYMDGKVTLVSRNIKEGDVHTITTYSYEDGRLVEEKAETFDAEGVGVSSCITRYKYVKVKLPAKIIEKIEDTTFYQFSTADQILGNTLKFDFMDLFDY